LKDALFVKAVEVQNVDNMKRRTLTISVNYTPEDSNQTKKEIGKEENRVIEYIKELIESDFHETFNLKIKKFKFAPTIKDSKKVNY
jgi:hypothetical protein